MHWPGYPFLRTCQILTKKKSKNCTRDYIQGRLLHNSWVVERLKEAKISVNLHLKFIKLPQNVTTPTESTVEAWTWTFRIWTGRIQTSLWRIWQSKFKEGFPINNIDISLLTFYHFVLSIIKYLIPNKTAGLQGKCNTQIIKTASFIGCQWLYFSWWITWSNESSRWGKWHNVCEPFFFSTHK